MLILQRLAIENSRLNDGLGLGEHDSNLKLGDILLGVNDILHFGLAGRSDDPRDWLRNLFTELIPVTEDTGSSVVYRAGRSMCLLSEIPELLEEDVDFVDLDAEFQRIAGVPIETFRAICLGLICNWTQDLEILIRNPNRLILRREWLNNVAIDPAILDSYLALLSADIEQYRREFSGRNMIEDLTPFKSRPLCRVPDGRYLVTDVILLAETLESHPFWKLNPHVEKLREFWGKCFEKYICLMTSALARPDVNKIYCNPVLETDPDHELCDMAVLYNDTLVLVEAKGVMFSAQVKYSGKPDKVFKIFEDRFVRNQKGDPKGVGQLTKAIRKMFRDRERVLGINTEGVRQVLPLVLALDQVGDNPLFSRALNLYFDARALRQECGVDIFPVMGMSAEAYEFLAAHLDEIPVAVLLKDWVAADETLRTPYIMAKTPVRNLLGNRKNEFIMARYEKLMAESVTRLFPGAPNVAGREGGWPW